MTQIERSVGRVAVRPPCSSVTRAEIGKGNPYSQLGIGNDDFKGRQAAKIRALTVTADLQRRFRMPLLGNAVFTAP